jgi:hypothetical protein
VANKKSKSIDQLCDELKLTKTLRKHLPFRRVTDGEARSELGLTTATEGDMAGIAIEGYDLLGVKRGVYQVRRDRPDVDEKGRPSGKYMSRPRSKGRFINTTPGKLKKSDWCWLCESPKSTWALTAAAERAGRHNVKVIDLNGLSGWLVRDTEKKDAPGRPSPDLERLAGHKVLILPDSNVWGRDDLWSQVSRLEAYLNSLSVEVRIGKVPALKGVNGPDDLIRLQGDKALDTVIEGARSGWEWQFPAVSDFTEDDRKIDLIVDHLVADKTLTLFASASENYKTMAALALCRDMLTGESAFEAAEFKVRKKPPGVIYNCPDMSQAVLLKYADQMKLAECPTFRIRTMKQGQVCGPDDPALIAAARAGYYIVLDTLGYFTEVTDDYQASQITPFFIKCRRLIDEYGAAGILALVHPTKPGARSSDIDVTEQVSGTYSKIGSVDTIFVLRRLNDPITNVAYAVWVSREKKRPFVEPLAPFTLRIRENSHCLLDDGRFPVDRLNVGKLADVLPPKNKGGRPEDPEKEKKVQWAMDILGQEPNMPLEKLAKAMAQRFNMSKPHERKTISKWLNEYVQEKRTLAKAAAVAGK